MYRALEAGDALEAAGQELGFLGLILHHHPGSQPPSQVASQEPTPDPVEIHGNSRNRKVLEGGCQTLSFPVSSPPPIPSMSPQQNAS